MNLSSAKIMKIFHVTKSSQVLQECQNQNPRKSDYPDALLCNNCSKCHEVNRRKNWIFVNFGQFGEWIRADFANFSKNGSNKVVEFESLDNVSK